jgi:hypothetical protein
LFVAPPPPKDREKHLRRESSALRSVHHLDRKLSATTRIPKRSTIVEGPAIDVALPTIIQQQRTNGETQQQSPPQQQARFPQRQQSLRYADQQPPSSSKQQPEDALSSSQPQQQQQLNLQTVAAIPAGSPLTSLASTPSATTASPGGGVLTPRPPMHNTNTQILITDHSPAAPAAPTSQDAQLPYLDAIQEDGDPVFSLADIPQLIESQQYRNSGRKLVAELNPLEFTILKYTALWKLIRSQLKDHIDLDEMLEFLETKKSGFWNKLLMRGGDKKVKKKGEWSMRD